MTPFKTYRNAGCAALLGFGLLCQSLPALANTPAGITSARAGDADLLRLIRHYEADGSYDTVEYRIPVRTPKPLTEMSIAEVMAWQRSLGRVTSTAVGGYQFIRDTLRDTVERYQIDPNARFDAQMQDHLARLLMRDCADAKARSTHAFANCLAGIWAALPLVTGPNKGKSKYRHIAGNRARTTPEHVLAVLEGAAFELKPPPAKSRKTKVAAPRQRFANGAVKVSRRSLIKAEIESMSKTGKAARSVVYKVDPYAQD